jgi:hypothetical protein
LTGDGLAVAGETWRLDAPETIQRLSSEITELTKVKTEDIVRHQIAAERLRTANKFWEDSRLQLPRSTELRQLRLQMEMAENFSSPNWRMRGGQYVGCATKERFDSLVGRYRQLPYVEEDIQRQRRFKPTAEFLVMAFSDLPGRISSFLFSYDTDNGPRPLVYTSPFRPEDEKKSLLPGVAMLDALFQPNNQYGDTAFVLLDPLIALRLHIKHMIDNSDLLPVAAVWPAAPPAEILNYINARQIIFWAQKADVDVFRHARAVNGRISISTAVMEDIVRHLRRRPPAEWLQVRIKKSDTWEAVLEEHLASIPLPEAESILLRMKMGSIDLEKFINGCSVKLRQRLDDFMKRNHRRQVTVGNETIVETDEGWFLNKNGTQLTNIIVRIEKTVCRQRDKADSLYYYGNILSKGKKLPFLCNQLDVHAFPEWLKRHMISNGLDLPFININPRYGAMMDIALAFNQPTTVRGYEGCGWDEKESCFIFPKFMIRTGGEIHEHEYLTFDEYHNPTLKFDKPRKLTDREVGLLKGRESPLAWAVLSCLVHNLLAAPYGYPRAGIAVVGDVGQSVEALACTMGCRHRNLVNNHTDFFDRLREYEERAWPIVITGIRPTSGLSAGWFMEGPHNCFTKMNWYTARACGTFGGWFRIEDKITTVHPNLLDAVKVALTAFLQHMMAKRLQRKSQVADSFTRVEHDLVEWFVSVGGTEEAVRAGCRQVHGTQAGADADDFIEIVCRLFDEGLLELKPNGFETNGKALIFDKGGNLWLPKSGINHALAKTLMPALDLMRLSQSMAKAGVLVSEKEYQGFPCWIVRDEWWQERLKTWRSRSRQLLKLIG